MLADLRRELEKEVTKDDFVKAVFYKIRSTKIKKSRKLIYNSFYAAQAKFDIPKDFRFIFDISSVVPYSDELYETLFRLETASILPTDNPSYEYYNITVSKNTLKKSFDKFDLSMKRLINQVSADLGADLKVSP